jgi:hypothetical protein
VIGCSLFAQVRGTPASGKTALCIALHHLLLERNKDKDVYVYAVHGWPEHVLQSERLSARWKKMIPEGVNGGRSEHYFLFDEAQESYWDQRLWNSIFKATCDGATNYRIVLFCSHGSASRFPNDYRHIGGTPFVMHRDARISLQPSPESQVTLLLTRPEYQGVLEKFQKKILFDEDLETAIYDWTRGHVGAVVSVLLFISGRVRRPPVAVDTFYYIDESLSLYSMKRRCAPGSFSH